MIDFKDKKFENWKGLDKINYLQRAILIYSYLYYDKSISIVSDKYFDSVSKQLAEIQVKNENKLNKTQYYKAFKDFDGTTGYYLFSRLNKEEKERIVIISKIIYKRFKKSGGHTLL